MNVLLVVIVVFFGINALVGMKRGLIKTVFAMFSVIVALLATAFLSPVITQKLQENEKVMHYFVEKADAVLPFDEVESMLNLEKKEAEQKKFLDSLPLPESIRKQLAQNNSRDFYKALGVDTFRAYLCNYVACMMISALSFVATFVAMIVLLKVLCFSLDLISKLPLLNQVNHLLGMVAGLAYALLLVWVGAVVLTALGSTQAGSNLMKQVNDSAFLSFLYNNNPLLGKVADLSKLFE
ncbi:MAG: CvpA family protein [Lachnospiraceae bacterium]|nr:CvpA family protein [Lachnospiraceae bacterium]